LAARVALGPSRHHAALTLRNPRRARLFRRHPGREDPEGHARAGAAHRGAEGRPLRAAEIRGPLRGRAKELLKKKRKGEAIEAPQERRPTNVVNLMDALRKSFEAERGGGARKPPALSRRQRRISGRERESPAAASVRPAARQLWRGGVDKALPWSGGGR
jgi:hypothetical protein